MRTVLKYPGSKWNIARQLVELIPPHHSYVEAFFGSGAMLFSKAPSDIETINDLDSDVTNLFRCVQKDSERLSRLVMTTPFSREEYDNQFEIPEGAVCIDAFERAAGFLVKCWQGHVATAFIQNPEGKPQVNHKETDKHNNRVGNLEWATNSENQIHAYKTGLNYVTGRAGRKKKPVCKLNLNTGEVIGTYKSLADAGRENGLHDTNIHKVLTGERKSCGGFGWKYESGVIA